MYLFVFVYAYGRLGNRLNMKVVCDAMVMYIDGALITLISSPSVEQRCSCTSIRHERSNTYLNQHVAVVGSANSATR